MSRRRIRLAFLAASLAFGCAIAPGYHRAEALYRSGSYSAAADAYRNFLRENPRSPLLASGHLGLAWSEFQLGNFREAVAACETVRSRFPGHPILPAVRLLEARSFLELTEYDRAAEEARAVADEDPAGVGVEARMLQGRALALSLRHHAAAEAFAQVLERAPYAAPIVGDAILARAEALLASGTPQDARDAAPLFRLYADRFPSSASRSRALARHARLVERDAPDSAVASWKEVLIENAHGPELDEALEALANLTLSRDPATAESYALRLFRIQIDTPAASGARLLLLSQRRRGDDAAFLRTAEEIRARFPRSFDVWAEAEAELLHRSLSSVASETAWRARIYDLEMPPLPAGDAILEAFPRAEAFLRERPDHPRAGQIARDRAVGLFIVGRWEDAEAATEEEVARFGEGVESRLRLAEIQRVRGKRREARAGLRGLLEDLPASHASRPTVLYRLAILAEADGDLLDAVRYVREVRRVAPGRLTPTEESWWRLREEEVGRIARAPYDGPRPRDPNRLSIYLHGFDSPSETTGYSGTLLTVLAAGLGLDPSFEMVTGDRVRSADVAFAHPDAPPTSLYPLRATLGADWLIGGTLFQDGAKMRLELLAIRVKPEGLLPVARTYEIPAEARLSFPRRLLREVTEILTRLR